MQGRAGPWFPGLGHKNLVQVATKRILGLVEVIWEKGDFQLEGVEVGKGSCEQGAEGWRLRNRRGGAGSCQSIWLP